MTDYWQYKAVHYWLDRVRTRQTYCLDASLFGVSGVVLPKEQLVARIWATVNPSVLHELQTRSEPYLPRLDLNGPAETALLTLWNHAPTREAIRELLVQAAREWLARAEQEGICGIPSKPLSDNEEIRRLVERGLLPKNGE